MADYIDDGGSHSYDAELSGTYTTQAANHALTLGADGEANTGFTLPTGSDWLLFETFNVENVATDIGYTKWQSDVSQVVTDIGTLRAAIISDSAVTNFECVAMHYKNATGKVDIYRADESTAFPASPTAGDTNLDFTFPTGSWKITDTVLAPDAGFTVVFSGVSNITDTSAHEITMTFSEAPKAATMTTTNITQQVQDNGTISSIAVTGDTKVWTFDYTADADVDDATNFFRAGTGILANADDSPLSAQTDSSNFTIDSSTAAELSSLYFSMGSAAGTEPSGITVTQWSGTAVPVESIPIWIRDEDDNPSAMRMVWDTAPTNSGLFGGQDGSDLGFLYDTQYYKYTYTSGKDITYTVYGLNPDHTYTFKTAAAHAQSGESFSYWMGGITVGTETVFDGESNTSTGATITGVTGVQHYDIGCEQGAGAATYLAGISILRTAGTPLSDDIVYLSVNDADDSITYELPHGEYCQEITIDTADNPLHAISGADTGWTGQVTAAFGGGRVNTHGSLGTDGSDFPDAVLKVSNNCASGTVVLTVDAGGTYTVKAIGSTELTATGRNMRVDIAHGGTAANQTLECANNYTNYLTFTGLTPDGSDQITLTYTSTGGNTAYANGIIIERTS